MKKIKLTTRRLSAAISQNMRADRGDDTSNIMLDPRYLRQSSSLIQDALQKGFDVLQLANGDIVMTGTKTVVYQYGWEEEKGKLVKAKSERKAKKLTAPSIYGEEELDESEEA
ncbi:MAG: DUF2671 domain-containing protein [Alphaproteobacteria bacterium]|nr:DUF2671 domain-containing protein [Alphaproteobacteria bacterium]